MYYANPKNIQNNYNKFKYEFVAYNEVLNVIL